MVGFIGSHNRLNFPGENFGYVAQVRLPKFILLAVGVLAFWFSAFALPALLPNLYFRVKSCQSVRPRIFFPASVSSGLSAPNKACTGRRGVCPVFSIVLASSFFCRPS